MKTVVIVLVGMGIGIGCGSNDDSPVGEDGIDGRPSLEKASALPVPETKEPMPKEPKTESAERAPEKKQPDSDGGKVYSFDPAIEAAIRNSISKPSGMLTKVDLDKVRWIFYLDGTKLNDVSELQVLTNLSALKLRCDNELMKWPTGIDKLTNLEQLGLEHNLTSLPPELDKLPKLKNIAIERQQIDRSYRTGKAPEFNKLESLTK